MNATGTRFLTASLLLVAVGCSADRLTMEMRQKLDPPLTRLLEGQAVDAADYDQSLRPDGAKEYSVIMRGTNPEEIRTAGIHLNSVFGEVMTARLTTAELLKVVRLGSVKSIRTGDKPRTLQ